MGGAKSPCHSQAGGSRERGTFMNTRLLSPARQEMMLKIILAAFFISFFIYIALYIFYGYTLATVPNKATGEMFPLNLHGHIVYLSRSQHQLLKAFGSLSFLFGAIFASIGAIMLYRHGTGYQFR
jgi:ammonia channel protein AmtB